MFALNAVEQLVCLVKIVVVTGILKDVNKILSRVRYIFLSIWIKFGTEDAQKIDRIVASSVKIVGNEIHALLTDIN